MSAADSSGLSRAQANAADLSCLSRRQADAAVSSGLSRSQANAAALSPAVRQAARDAVPARLVMLARRVLELGSVREVCATDDLRRDLFADSLDVVNLVMAAEEEFGVSISDDEGQGIATLADMAALVCAKLGLST